MRPASSSVVQAIRFAGVDAARIVGGGMDPVDSDVGLWVMGAGQLDLAGTPKTGWTRAAGSVGAGATEVPLQTAPTGWQAGDDVSIAPTAKPDGGSDFYKGFDESAVAASSSGSVRLATPTRRAHPEVNGQWGAEVMNLTRNVRIEGTAAGPAHVFIRSSKPQTVRYTQIRHVSVLKGSATPEGKSGRYGLHFHMMGEASRGSVVEGVVVRDAGSHTFVAHASHGITFRDDISYNNVRDAFWWDPSPNNREPGDPTNDTLIDGSIVAKSLGVPDDNRDYRLSAFNLGMGRNNTIRNSTAVGTGGTAGSAGFGWPEDAGQNIPGNGVWTFNQGNVSHNNHDNGLFVWQNTDTLHDVSNFVSYHNGSYGIEHGAYINSYRYANATLYGNGKAGINTKAKPKPMRPLSFENLIVDGGGSSPHGLVSFDHVAEDDPLPTLFFCTVFKGQTGAAVGLSTGSEHRAPEIMDFVESQLSGAQFSMKSLLSGTRIRVQNGGAAFQLDAAGNRTTISPFVTVRGGCAPGPTTPPGLPGAPSPNPPPTPGPAPGPAPGPTTTQPGPSTDLDHQASAPTDANHRPADDPAAGHHPAAAGPTPVPHRPAADHRPRLRRHRQRHRHGHRDRRRHHRHPPRRPLRRRRPRTGRLPRPVPVRLARLHRPPGNPHPPGGPDPHQRQLPPLGPGHRGDHGPLTRRRSHKMDEPTAPGRVLQMRLVVEAPDYEQAVAFYRDVLGAPEELTVEGDAGEKVTILDMGRATLELSNPAQVAMIDAVEVGRRISPRLRVAFEVADTRAVTNDLVDAGADLLASPTLTPWQSLNSRLSAPANLQITLFEEPGESAGG